MEYDVENRRLPHPVYHPCGSENSSATLPLDAPPILPGQSHKTQLLHRYTAVSLSDADFGRQPVTRHKRWNKLQRSPQAEVGG